MSYKIISFEPLNNKGKCVALASVCIDDCWEIHEIKLMRGEKGMFLIFPSRKLGYDGNPSYKDLVHLQDKAVRKKLTQELAEIYFNCCKKHLSDAKEMEG